MVVLTTPRDSRAVTAWLTWERLRSTLVTSDQAIATADGITVPAPAVLLMRGPVTILTGVAHPTRVANLRLVSFVSELDLH